jgi:hypothetical protein
MIRTAEAFEAIAQTLALGSMAYEHQRAANGCYLACLDARAMNILTPCAKPRRGL